MLLHNKIIFIFCHALASKIDSVLYAERASIPIRPDTNSVRDLIFPTTQTRRSHKQITTFENEMKNERFFVLRRALLYILKLLLLLLPHENIEKL